MWDVLSCTQERDKLQNETISRDDMIDVFRIYGVREHLHPLLAILSTILITIVVARGYQNTTEEDCN